MGIRFWRRIKIAPGVTLNISKTSGSLSFGPRGAKFTIGPHGKRTTIGATGTGLFYTKVHSKKKSAKPTQSDPLDLGFLQKITTSEEEKHLVNALKELGRNNENEALKLLKQATSIVDAAYLAAIISLNNNMLDNAEKYFLLAEQNHQQLGNHFDKYGVDAIMTLQITDEVSTKIAPSLRGILLGLVETYQSRQAWQEAIRCLKTLRKLDPDDIVAKLSLAELLLDAQPNNNKTSQTIVELAQGVENDTEVHTALLLYKGKALRQLGLTTAARDTLTTALRRKKGRSDELLRYLRYERAAVYDDLGQKSRGRTELEKLYAETPNFEDVAEKLGL